MKNKNVFKNKPYANILHTLEKIFDNFGKPYFIPLLKLRKLWFSEMDSFLSENSYPRNISIHREFKVNSDFLSELESLNLSIDLYQMIKKMNGKSFNRSDQFFVYLKKKFDRPIKKSEIELLKNKIQLKPIKNILHLTVYDGSISYAIKSEIDGYLRILNKLLPEIKFEDIHCHVGEVEKIILDQRYVASLAKDWHFLTPEEIRHKCIPAFIHRFSKNQAILMLYVSNEEDLDTLKHNLGLKRLLEHLQKHCPEFPEAIKKIKLIIFKDVDLEKIRLASIFVGEAYRENSLYNQISNTGLQSNFSNSTFSAKANFSKICKKLKI